MELFYWVKVLVIKEPLKKSQLVVPLQGLGANFIPSILNREILDGIITVGKDEAFSYAQRAAKEEGLFIGVSSGAALAGVAKKLSEIPKGSKILTFNYDTGERYLSVEGLF